jgi:hypothetical protein
MSKSQKVTRVKVTVVVEVEHEDKMPLAEVEFVASDAVKVRELWASDQYGFYTTVESEYGGKRKVTSLSPLW